MKRIKFSLILTFLLFLNSTGCAGYYPDMTGTVVDAETGQPIEGAVVLVEWTKKVGIGDYHTESVKVVEVVTDEKGKFKVTGIVKPFIEPPDMTIYKKGYVAWNNKVIFPEYKKREGFKWRSGNIYKLDRFKPEYSHIEHTSFIHSATNASISSNKMMIEKAYRWEELESSNERDKRDQRKIPNRNDPLKSD